jgi:tetratricopeptide (TPR) repeat protein
MEKEFKMNQFHRMHGFSTPGVLALILVFAGRILAQFPGWDPRWPSPERMLAGCDPQVVRQFKEQSAALVKNPKDEGALVDRAVYAQRLARTSRFGTFWLWLAAKDLEQAIAIDPRDFAAWHNYGDVNYQSGDFWPSNDHSNAHRALTAFDKALALNPKSARSYMGRGWVYQDLDDVAHANADFQRALQLDPSLRADMQKEIGNIRERHRQVAGARGTIEQMSRYYVEKSARTVDECDKYKGHWTAGECRLSLALYPGR